MRDTNVARLYFRLRTEGRPTLWPTCDAALPGCTLLVEVISPDRLGAWAEHCWSCDRVMSVVGFVPPPAYAARVGAS